MAIPLDQLLEILRTQEPDYFAWLLLKPGAMDKIIAIAERLGAQATGAGHQVTQQFLAEVRALKSYATWKANPTEPPPDEEPLPEEPPPAEEPPPTTPPVDPGPDREILGMLQLFLQENGLPMSLMAFIENALAQKWSYSEIIARLRQTPEYLAAYPENAMREANGLSWWPEARIREYRDSANALIKSYLGVFDPAGFKMEIASLMARGVDLGEWERRLQTHQSFLQWGPAVQQALSLELGFEVPDERVWAFMNPDIPTPELDLAYRRALMRGQPAVLGFGIRPEEEADILIQYGFDPTTAFEGYSGIASELPRAERLRMIESYINGQETRTPTNPLGQASYGLLFNALMLKDADSLTVLQQMLARETALFQAGGGPAGGGVGLLSPELR